MRGLIWTSAIWAIALVVVNPRGIKGFLSSGRIRLTREQIAITLALLGTHTFASGSSSEEIINNPATLERVIRGGLAGLALLVVLPTLLDRIQQWRPTHRWRSMTAITVYALVGIASLTYSVAPLVSFGKIFELSVGLAIVWAVALSADGATEARNTIRFVVFLEAALVIGASVLFFADIQPFAQVQSRPGFLFAKTMGSPFAHSNALSASGGLIAAYSLAMYLTSRERSVRWRWAGLFGAGTLGVILASGRQGLVMWMAAVGILLFVHRRRIFSLLIGPAVGLAIFVYYKEFFSIFTRGNAGNLGTLTGRTVKWEAAIEAWFEHAFTGYGFGAGGRFVALASLSKDASNLHGGYFEALIGVGLFGFIPLVYAMLRNTGWAARALRRAQSTEVAILMVPLLLHTLVSLGFAAWLTADFFLFGSIAVIADIERRRPLRRPELQPAGAGRHS